MKVNKNKTFIPVAILMAIFLVAGAFFVRTNIEIGVEKYLGEVEAISYDAKSLIIRNREDKLVKVFFRPASKVADNIGMKVEFSNIKPGSVIEINGSLNEFKNELNADFIKIGLSPNIIVFRPLSFEKLGDVLLISGEVRSRNGELKIRIKNQDDQALISDTITLGDFEAFEYVKFEKAYSKKELNLKPEDKLIKVEIFQMRVTDKSETDLVTVFVGV